MRKTLEQQIAEIEERKRERALRKGSHAIIESVSPAAITREVARVSKAPKNYSEAKKLYGTVEYNEWRRKVFLRDGHQCQMCGQPGGELEVHHIRPKRLFPHLTLELNNGIVLCKFCHQNRVTRYEAKYYFIFDRIVKLNTRS